VIKLEKEKLKFKLSEKLFNRIGMTVFEKDTMRKGMISSFIILDNPNDSFSINYIVYFTKDETISLETVHESKLVLLKGTEI
jgi:hypothetical protein